MSLDEIAGAQWRKSSRSNGSGGNNCVEVATLTKTVAVRDSKDPTGPVLIFSPVEWDSFVAGIRAGTFHLFDDSQ
ncbi:hypothetical protein Q0Z83_010080 [Actinoplanes sichuanensis]|uniref:DUF397 domain-containing protein n=1 Tax=Actinoplanes sichuanensis TaxID=512349 RepID=A0ABW4A638_9ACTN|nr:DUF397 domain-containing protein [Actinoplanes sichuanensis]BEL02817.1 hypothetical protein Q0Z83_010080 [Actinoplanes sichuanensis]